MGTCLDKCPTTAATKFNKAEVVSPYTTGKTADSNLKHFCTFGCPKG